MKVLTWTEYYKWAAEVMAKLHTARVESNKALAKLIDTEYKDVK